MKKMNRILILSIAPLITILFFASCGKKDNNPAQADGYYVKFNVAGTSYKYDGYPYATFSNSNGLYLGGFGSFKVQSEGTKNVVSVLIGSVSPLTPDTYSGLVSPPSGGNSPAIFFSWIDENGKTFTSLYKDNTTNTATITSMTSSSIKGTFSGKIYEALNQDSDPLTFSGEFVVKRMN